MDSLQPIQNLIYEIRGQKVMLDFNLATLYEVETKNLKRAVNRNIKRFPSDFMFELTEDEWKSLRCQIGTLKKEGRGQHIKYLPYAFTEQGVAMLSGLLNSDVAIDMNIKIMRAFVFVRQLVLNPPTDNFTKLQQDVKQLKEYVEGVFFDYDDINENTRFQLEQINQTLAEMQTHKQLPDKPRRKIGYFTEQQRQNNEDMIE